MWVVDDYKEAIFKFSHDGKQLLQTIGTPNQAGADDDAFQSAHVPHLAAR